MPDALEQHLLAQLFLDWLQHRTGERPLADATGETGIVAAQLAGKRLLVALEPAYTAEPPASWQATLDGFRRRLQCGEHGILIWLPAGAEVPVAEPRASTAVEAVQRVIAGLAPGETADTKLPITITIRKRDEAGAYVSAFGGLAPLWAQFTDRVQGYYQIDSTELHRLPNDERYIKDLIDRIVEASTGLALNDLAVIEAEDCWRVQRLNGGDGCVLLGVPPGDESESGSPLRKRLRTAIRTSAERLGSQAGDLRVLAIYGHYPSLEGEPVGPALRGQDPALFRGLDMVVLIADGSVKPLIDITRQAIVQPRARG